MYLFAYTYVYSTSARTQVSMHACIHACMNAHCMYVYTHKHTYACVQTYVEYMCACHERQSSIQQLNIY